MLNVRTPKTPVNKRVLEDEAVDVQSKRRFSPIWIDSDPNQVSNGAPFTPPIFTKPTPIRAGDKKMDSGPKDELGKSTPDSGKIIASGDATMSDDMTHKGSIKSFVTRFLEKQGQDSLSGFNLAPNMQKTPLESGNAPMSRSSGEGGSPSSSVYKLLTRLNLKPHFSSPSDGRN